MSEFAMPDRESVDPAATGWPDINLPEMVKLELPTFPAELLPKRLAAMVRQTASAIQAPVDIAGMIALPVAASTLAGKVRFLGRTDHREHAMLWTLPVAASSERKTPVFERLRAPLTELDRELNEQIAIDDEIRATQLEMIVTQVDALKKEANKAAADRGGSSIADSARAELVGLIEQRRVLEKPLPRPTEWVTSPTPEGLQRVMAAGRGRAAVFTDEGGIIGTLAGRYSGKDGADMDPFLSGYVGQPLRSPRAGSDRPYVDAAYLTMGIAVQPTVIDDLAAVKGAEERGLVGRFLFGISTSLVGSRMYRDFTPITDEVADAYADALRDWAVWHGEANGSLVEIGLDDQAFRAYEKFYDAIEIKQGPGGDLANQYTVSKIQGTTLRIAGLFHCFDLGRRAALGTAINEDSMRRAIDLAEGYFIPHGLRVAAQIREVGPQGVEARILEWIKRGGHREFKLRDLNRALAGKRGSVQHAADLLDPLEALVEEGYLREFETGNKASRAFKVNPGLFVASR